MTTCLKCGHLILHGAFCQKCLSHFVVTVAENKNHLCDECHEHVAIAATGKCYPCWVLFWHIQNNPERAANILRRHGYFVEKSVFTIRGEYEESKNQPVGAEDD